MEFGVPKIRERKEDKYSNQAVITFLPTGPGLGRKIELNNKAIELLQIDNTDNQVSFSFSGEDIYIVNTSGMTVSGLKVGKTTNGFADKKHYNYIKGRTFKMKDEDTLELFFEDTSQEYNGKKVFKLVSNIVDTPVIESNLDKYGSPIETTMPEYTDEQLEQLNSQAYAEELEITSPEQLYNEN